MSSGRVSTAGTLWDCQDGNGAKGRGPSPGSGVGGINTCLFNAGMAEFSLPTRSRTATNTTRGLTLQISSVRESPGSNSHENVFKKSSGRIRLRKLG